MLDFFDLIRNGGKYIVRTDLGKTFDIYLAKNENEYHLLVANCNLMDRWSIEKLFDKYYIQDVFELSNCYLGVYNEPYMYWHLTKEKPVKIRTAVYYNYAHSYRDNEDFNGKLRIPDKYNEDYKRYISILESWTKYGLLPTDIKYNCEFNEIKEDEFDYTKPYARYYRKANDELRRLLRSAKIVNLRDVADVIRVSAKDGGNDTTKVKALDLGHVPTYPFVPELQAIDSFISTVIIHKGDIVELDNKEFFLINKESSFDLYAPIGTSVIRAKGVCTEYLYLYLNSLTAKRIINAYKIQLGDYASTSLEGTLEEFPVILPEEDDSIYKDKFLKLSSPDVRFYDSIGDAKQSDTIEHVLVQELKERIKLNNDNLIKKQIEEDVSELNICYANKAYKSTLILAGSIMEALLIDWLSEIRGVNYFVETLQKRLYDKDNKCYSKDENGNYIYREDTRADLADYIDEIRDIKRPEWMEEAEEAHKIRDKRNLVHAKLCLRKSAEINDDTCKKVIGYLKNIIESRWK